jgi:hypothetical protein
MEGGNELKQHISERFLCLDFLFLFLVIHFVKFNFDINKWTFK